MRDSMLPLKNNLTYMIRIGLWATADLPFLPPLQSGSFAKNFHWDIFLKLGPSMHIRDLDPLPFLSHFHVSARAFSPESFRNQIQ